ncbi:hypothetical protein JCM3774_004165 [Rhodotorula dairenensis]
MHNGDDQSPSHTSAHSYYEGTGSNGGGPPYQGHPQGTPHRSDAPYWNGHTQHREHPPPQQRSWGQDPAVPPHRPGPGDWPAGYSPRNIHEGFCGPRRQGPQYALSQYTPTGPQRQYRAYGTSAGANGNRSGQPTPHRSDSSVFLGGQSTFHRSQPYPPQNRPPSQPRTDPRPSTDWQPPPPSRDFSDYDYPPPPSSSAGNATAVKGLSVAGINLPPVKELPTPSRELDLVSPEPSRPTRSRSSEGDPDIVVQFAKGPREPGSNMSTFKPLDPSEQGYPVLPTSGRGVRGVAWNSGFHDDVGESGSSSARKNTTTYGGNKSGLSKNFNLPRMKAVNSTAFHSSAGASSSRQVKQRVVLQGDDPTPKEIAGQRAMQRQAEAQAKQPKQTRKAKQARLDVKGKGRAKSPALVIEIDSTDDEREASTHRDEDADDPIDSDEDGDRRPSTSAARTAKTTTRGRVAAREAFVNEDHPSSPDPLGMNAARPPEHRNKVAMRNASRIADATLGGPLVSQRVRDIEARERQARAQPQETVAGSLGRKQGSKRTGSPTDDGEFEPLTTTTKSGRVPRAAKSAIAAGQRHSGDAENKVYEVDTKPFFVGMGALADKVGTTCHVVVTACKDRWLDKLTLRTEHDPYENEVEIKAVDVTNVSYWPEDSDDKPAHIVLLLRNQTLFDKLYNMATEPHPSPRDRSVVIILHEGPTATWHEEPDTPEDQLFYSVAVGWASKKKPPRPSSTKVSASSASGLMGFYNRLVEEMTGLEGGRGKKTGKGMQKKPPDPKQLKLHFGTSATTTTTANSLRRDECGDFTEWTPPTSRAGGDDFDEEVQVQSGSAVRRSSRPSTSGYANVTRPADPAVPAAAPVSVLTEEEKRYQQWLKEQDAIYRPDEIVAEFPPGQPGAITLPWSDVKRLQPDEFLNDTLIELGLKQILKRIEERDASLPDHEKIAPHVHIFNSFFYKQLSTPKKKGVDPYKLVEKWTKKVNLFEKRFIVVPINEHFHWYLAMIINPSALLRPPPPPIEAPPPRQSGRTKQRESAVGTDGASEPPEAPGAEVKSHHFGKSRIGSDVDMLDNSQAASPVDPDEQEHEQQIARGIEAELRQRRDPLATSPGPMRAESGLVASELAPTSRTPSSQPEATQMQVDPATPAPIAPSEHTAMPLDNEDISVGSDEDVAIQSQRGTLEGGGPSLRTPGSGKHMRWHDGAEERTEEGAGEEALSPPNKAGSPDITFVQAPAARTSTPAGHGPADARTSTSVEPGVSVAEQTSSQPTNAALAAELFGSAADSDLADPMRKSQYGAARDADEDDDDDDVLVVNDVRQHPPTLMNGDHDARASSTSKATSSSAAKRPQAVVPRDPEPDRAQKLERERAEEELRKKKQEEAELAARAQRKQQALDDARAVVDMDGCWILTFDSLGGFHKAVTNKLKGYLVSEAMSKLSKRPEELSIDQVQCGKADVPQQPNYCDCGLYLLHFVERFLSAPDGLLNVIAAGQPAAAKGGKKTQQAVVEAEQDRNEAWAFGEATSRRARMRDEVKLLVEQYAAGADERREREEREREQRRLKRQEEQQRRQEEVDREAVRRAERLEAEEFAAQASIGGRDVSPRVSHAGVDGLPAAGPVVLSVRGAAAAHASDASEPKAHAISIKGAANGQRAKPTPASAQAAVMELSDDQSSTQGSPRKPLPGGPSHHHPTTVAQLEQFAAPPSPTRAKKTSVPEELRSPREPAHQSNAEQSFALPGDDSLLRDLANGVDHGVPGSQGVPARRQDAGASRAAAGEPESSAAAHDADSSDSSDAEETVAEPPRRKVDHGRTRPVAETEVARQQQARDEYQSTPELALPAANQQQQEREEIRTAAGQKRATRSSTRGSSVHGAEHNVHDRSDSERPSKRIKGGSSANTSRGASRASSPGGGGGAEENQETALLAKNTGKKGRARLPAQGRSSRGRSKKPAAEEDESATQLGEMTLESDDDE